VSGGVDLRTSISHDSLRMLDNMRGTHSITPSASHDSLHTLEPPARTVISQAVLDNIRPSVSHDDLRANDEWPSPSTSQYARASAQLDLRSSTGHEIRSSAPYDTRTSTAHDIRSSAHDMRASAPHDVRSSVHDMRSSAYDVAPTDSYENLRAALSREILPSPSQDNVHAHADEWDSPNDDHARSEELPYLPPPPAPRPREGSSSLHDAPVIAALAQGQRTHSGTLHNRAHAHARDNTDNAFVDD
jgi:hypothetical protein